MADAAIVDRAVQAAPKDYTVGNGVDLALKAVRATIDGTGAAGIFRPALQLVAPDGTVMWTSLLTDGSGDIAAGGTADVSWFPGVKRGGAKGSTIGASTTIFHQQLAAPSRTIDTGANAIPATFAHFQIICRLRTTQAVVNDIGVITMNGDTGANYDRASVTWNGTGVSFSSTYATTGMTMDALGASAGASRFATIFATFADYTDPSSFKNGQATGAEIGTPADGNVRLSLTTDWTWKSTAAINRITITPLTAAVNWDIGTSMTILGIPPTVGS